MPFFCCACDYCMRILGEGRVITVTRRTIIIYYIKIKYYYIYTTAREKIIVNYCKRFRQLDIMGDGEGLKTEK